MYASMSWNSLLALFFFTTLAIAQNASDPSRKIDGNSLNSPQQQEQADESMQSESGIAGRDEPGTYAPLPGGTPVFKDGLLDVPGAPRDGPTVPSKFSERNAALDKLPRVILNEKQKVALMLGAGGDLVAQINPTFGEAIPSNVTLNDLPQTVDDLPALRGLKYIRLIDRIILVDPANRLVVGAVITTTSNR